MIRRLRDNSHGVSVVRYGTSIAMDLFINIFGYAATVCMLCGYMPQAIYTMRTKDTDGIALPTFLSMGLGSIFFAIQGALIPNLPLLITNVITAACSIIITVIKIRNDIRRKGQKGCKNGQKGYENE